jgi:hypothetical protein
MSSPLATKRLGYIEYRRYADLIFLLSFRHCVMLICYRRNKLREDIYGKTGYNADWKRRVLGGFAQ